MPQLLQCTGEHTSRACSQLPSGNLDAWLSPEEAVTAAGLASLAATTLRDAAIWCHWADDRHFTRVELPTLQQSMLAPLRWLAPSALRPRYLAYLSARALDDEAWVKAQTCDAYKMFASQLCRSGGPFLFGTRYVVSHRTGVLECTSGRPAVARHVGSGSGDLEQLDRQAIAMASWLEPSSSSPFAPSWLLPSQVCHDGA